MEDLNSAYAKSVCNNVKCVKIINTSICNDFAVVSSRL